MSIEWQASAKHLYINVYIVNRQCRRSLLWDAKWIWWTEQPNIIIAIIIWNEHRCRQTWWVLIWNFKYANFRPNTATQSIYWEAEHGLEFEISIWYLYLFVSYRICVLYEMIILPLCVPFEFYRFTDLETYIVKLITHPIKYIQQLWLWFKLYKIGFHAKWNGMQYRIKI